MHSVCRDISTALYEILDWNIVLFKLRFKFYLANFIDVDYVSLYADSSIVRTVSSQNNKGKYAPSEIWNQYALCLINIVSRVDCNFILFLTGF
jgi:hypothetical protein